MNQRSDEPLTPKQNKKRAVQLSPVRDEEEAEEDEADAALAMLRPVRTARVKAVNSLKEPSLNRKMRRPASIKQERVSDEARKENIRPNDSARSTVNSNREESVVTETVPSKKTDKKRKGAAAGNEESVVVSNETQSSDSGLRTSGDGSKKVKVLFHPFLYLNILI